MGVVRYVGIKSLEAVEQEKLKTLVLQYLEKLDRFSPNYTCRVHIKNHDIEGRVNYSLHAKITNPSLLFSADASDWDLRRTIHKLMKKILNAAEHTFHRQGQQQQRFHLKKAKRGTSKRVSQRLRGRKML